MHAKTVIELWLWGGPSSLETFDPKPNASVDFNNGLKSIPTNVPGVEIHEWWPELAKCADLYSLVRTMTHPHFGHETATYLMQTGRNPGGGDVYPAIGAVIAMMKEKEYKGDLPPYVILTSAKGRFSEVGFLGDRYAPLVTGGNPTQPQFVVDGIVPPGGSGPEALQRRFDLLSDVDTFDVPGAFEDFAAAGREARRIIEGDAAKTFDLAQEPDEVRERYGRTWIGQSLLAARRLVEYGVPYITVNMSGWDSHKRHFETMKQKTRDTDRALAALLRDLADRNLLDSTVVWVSGEFGRTTKIDRDPPWNGGRNHYPRCFSALVAGGGFKGGCVVGESDETATTVVKRPVTPVDFLGSIYECCGIDPDGPMPNPVGKTLTILPPPSKEGRLKEIYKKFLLPLAFAGFAFFSAQAADPYVGYIYPAGLQTGTTNRVIVGGQNFNGAKEGIVSGDGVRILSVAPVPNFPQPTSDQRKYLTTWLEGISKGETNAPPISEKAQLHLDEWRSNRWWSVLHTLDPLQLSIVERDLCVKRNPLQASPSLKQLAIVTVAVDADAAPGAREFRLWAGNGMSPPRPFIVSSEPRVIEPHYTAPFRPAPDMPIVETLPVVLDGQVMPGETDRWKVRLTGGRPVVFRTVAREFQPYVGDAVPGFFNAALRLVDEAGKEIAFADDNLYHPDPVLVAVPPADGLYTLEIHDVLYRGREDFVYSVFCEQGADPPESAPGRLDPPESTPGRLDPASSVLWPLPDTSVPADALLATFSGCVKTPGSTTEHAFTVSEPGEYVLDLLARRAGSPLDGRLEVLDAAGTVLATLTDVTNKVHCGSIIQGELDPVGTVNVPQAGTYRIRVSDEAGKGGTAWMYTLRVYRPAPRFEAWLSPSGYVLRKDAGKKAVATVIRRDGFAGDVRLEENEFFRFKPDVIPAASNRVEVSVIAKPKKGRPPQVVEVFATDGRTRVAVRPADEYNQAFAWDHLLPAQAFRLKAQGGGGKGASGKLPRPSRAGDTLMSVGASARGPGAMSAEKGKHGPKP